MLNPVTVTKLRCLARFPLREFISQIPKTGRNAPSFYRFLLLASTAKAMMACGAQSPKAPTRRKLASQHIRRPPEYPCTPGVFSYQLCTTARGQRMRQRRKPTLSSDPLFVGDYSRKSVFGCRQLPAADRNWNLFGRRHVESDQFGDLEFV